LDGQQAVDRQQVPMKPWFAVNSQQLTSGITNRLRSMGVGMTALRHLNKLGRKGLSACLVFAAMLPFPFVSHSALAQGSSDNATHGDFASSSKKEVTWQRDLHIAMKEAKTNDKMILIDVYTDWCGPCKMLDTHTYSNPEVATYLNKNFICVKVNAEDPTLGNWVAAKYRIEAYPSIVVLAPNRQVKGKFVGFRNPQEFLREVSRLTTK
jgi:thiol:disulfide interchange protein